MANVRVTYDFDAWDAATITSSSEADTELADDNVVENQPSKIWRTTGVAAEWVKFDLGSATNLTCFGVFNFNLTAAATVTLEAHASDSFGSPSYSQALTLVTDDDSVVVKRCVLFLDETYRWWRLTIADAGNTDGYIDIGRIAAGAYHSFTRNIGDGFYIDVVDGSEREKLPGAFSPARSRDRYHSIDVGFPLFAQAQADRFRTIFSKMGNEKPCILALDPTSRPSLDSFYCTLETSLPLLNASMANYRIPRLVFEEKVR